MCTVLFGVDTTDLTGPLTIFQHTRFDETDFKKLVKSINASAGDDKLDDAVLDNVFKMWWPQLHDRVNKILAEQQTNGVTSNRTERDILEEILELSRLNSRRRSARDIPPELMYELLEGLQEFAVIAASGDREMLPSAFRHVDRPMRMLSRSFGSPELEGH